MDPQDDNPNRKDEISDLERARRMADHRKEYSKSLMMGAIGNHLKERVQYGSAPRRSDYAWVGEVARIAAYGTLIGGLGYFLFRDNGSDTFTLFNKHKTEVKTAQPTSHQPTP